jgi:hypothetical protein
MTVAEFKTKWSRYRGKEPAACQEHFQHEPINNLWNE